jgi:hypothetical protein
MARWLVDTPFPVVFPIRGPPNKIKGDRSKRKSNSQTAGLFEFSSNLVLLLLSPAKRDGITFFCKASVEPLARRSSRRTGEHEDRQALASRWRRHAGDLHALGHKQAELAVGVGR